jgi:hypothetical protein
MVLMILSFLLAFSGVLEVMNESIIHSLEVGPPLCMQFYDDTCPTTFLEEFNLAAQLFPSVTFARINCSNFRPICRRYSARSRHEIRVMRPRSETFHGEEIAVDIVNFIEVFSGIDLQLNFSTNMLTPPNFSTFVESKSHCLVCFLDFRNRQSEIMLPQIQQLTLSFLREKNVGMAYIDCSDILDFCMSKNINAAPIVRVYSGGKTVDYQGAREFALLLNFANREFGTFRKSDGGLNEFAGIVPGTFEIVQRFMKSARKEDEMREIGEIQGTGYYRRVMKRLIKQGKAGLEDEIRKFSFMKESAGNHLDLIEVVVRNLTVLHEFERAGEFLSSSEKEL